MIRKNSDFEFPDDISEDDASKLIDNLECYIVDMPSEDEINNTIENLRKFVPYKKTKNKSFKIFNLLGRASKEIGFMSSSYWLVSIILFILGTYSIWMNGGSITNNRNPYISAVLLAPVPFILGIIEIFRGREEGMIELELSCKVSIGEIMVSRLIIICIYNILLNSLLSAMLMHFNSGILFWRMIFMWLTPFTVISGIGLVLVSRMRGSYVALLFTSIWIVFVMAVLTQKKIVESIIGINTAAYCILTIIGAVIMVVQITRYWKRNNSFFERSVLGEAKN